MQFVAIVLGAMLAVTGAAALLQEICMRWLSSNPSATFLPIACGAGLILGLLLACAARCGTAPKLRARFFLKRGAALLLFVVFAAIVGGLAGYSFVRFAGVQIWDPHFFEVPRENHAAFLAVAGSQLFGGVAVLIGGTLLARVSYDFRRQAYSERRWRD